MRKRVRFGEEFHTLVGRGREVANDDIGDKEGSSLPRNSRPMGCGAAAAACITPAVDLIRKIMSCGCGSAAVLDPASCEEMGIEW